MARLVTSQGSCSVAAKRLQSVVSTEEQTYGYAEQQMRNVFLLKELTSRQDTLPLPLPQLTYPSPCCSLRILIPNMPHEYELPLPTPLSFPN